MLRWELWPSNLPVGESMMPNATAGDFISPEGGNVAGQSLSCLTLCDPINCSTPGVPVLHHPPGFSQTHVHWVGDAIQTSHSLSSLSSPALNFLSTRVFSNLVLCIRKPKYWNFSFSISPSVDIQGWFPLGLTGLIFLLSKGFLRVFSNIIVWKYQFFSN